MWFFKEIVNEAIEDIGIKNPYNYDVAPKAITTDTPDKRFVGERFYLDLGPGYGLNPIVNITELKDAFDEIRKGKEATAEMVNQACRNGFFDVWIASNSVGTAIATIGKDGKKKIYSNKGVALEYIFGKDRDNESESDIIGAELKAYAGLSPTVTLFGLAPYEILHYPTKDSEGIPKENSEMQNILKGIRKKINAADEKTRNINSKEFTDYSVNQKSYAKVIINEDNSGTGQEARSLNIFTQFYSFDNENNVTVPIDAIECIYSIDETQEILYQKTGKIGANDEKDDKKNSGKVKKNLYKTIADKIQTIYSFSTIELLINGVPAGAIPGVKDRVLHVYAYNKLHISTIKNLDELMLNFIDCINSGDIVISFKITKTLSFSTNFMIKNSVESYDKLYKSRSIENKPLFQYDRDQTLGTVDASTLVIKNPDGSYENIYDDWFSGQAQVKDRLKKAETAKKKRAAKANTGKPQTTVVDKIGRAHV